MATTDQNFTVYAAAQQVVSSYLQAHNSSLVEAGNPLVAAIVNLNAVLNGLPEYTDPSSVVVTKFNGSVRFELRTSAGSTIPGAPKAGFAGAGVVPPYLALPLSYGCFQSTTVTALPGGATVKGIVDNTITKATMYIDVNGVLQSITLAV